jgi:hypothetical protein
MGRVKAIRFETIECSRCHSPRIIGAPCGECGALGRPNEVNGEVVRRRTLIERVESLRSKRQGPPPTFSELSTWPQTFIDALSTGIKAPLERSSASTIAQRLDELDMWREALAGPQLRPEVAKKRALLEIVHSLSELWPLYARALTSLSLREAQALSSEGQRVLDSAAMPIVAHSEAENRLALLGDPESGDFFDRAVATMQRLHPGKSIAEIGSKSVLDLGALLGVQPNDPGVATQFALYRSISRVFLDESQFVATTKKAFDLLSNDILLRRIANQPASLNSLGFAERAHFDAFRTYEAALVSGTFDTTFLVRQLIKLYAEVLEEGFLPLAAWYLLAIGAKSSPFESLLREDATKLVEALTLNDTSNSIVIGFDKYLRHAASHGHSYRVEGDRVVFSLRSFEKTLSVAEVGDTVLALLESLASMTIALHLRMSALGVKSVTSASDREAMGLSTFRMSTFALSQYGTVISAIQNDDLWSFQLKTEHEPFTLAASLVVLNEPVPCPVQVARVPPAPSAVGARPASFCTLRRKDVLVYAQPTSERDGLQITSSLITLLFEARNETGTRLITRDDLRFAVGCAAISLLLHDDLSVIPFLRQFKKYATDLGDVLTLSTVNEAFVSMRAEGTGSDKLLLRLRQFSRLPSPAVPSHDTVRIT